MPGVFDDTLKHLTELSPDDWVVQGGWSAAPARLMDADIATISGATDKVIRVAGSPDWLLAVDFQAGHDTLAKLPDLLLYNSALFKRHGLRVRTLLVLLHPDADSPQATGFYERGFPGEPFDVALRYRLVRVWQVPAKTWLTGGLGLLPLAPLGDVLQQDLPAVVTEMKRRLDQEAPPKLTVELWSAAYILMGLRYERALIQKVLQGVLSMKQSVTYQAIIEEGLSMGQIEEARRMLFLLGRQEFGEPSQIVRTALEAVSDVGTLEKMVLQVKHVSNWEELVGLNGASVQ